MSEQALLGLYRSADALLNVTGAQEIRDEQRACPRRIYVERCSEHALLKSAQARSFSGQIF